MVEGTTGGVRIREMAPADLPAARRLLGQLGYDIAPEELARRVAAVAGSPGHAALVAERGRIVAGLAHVFERPALDKPREAVLQALVVDAASRQGGVGRALMAAAEAWAAGRGLPSVVLSSNVARIEAHAFYEAIGYRRVATSLLLRKALDRVNLPE
ncbi:MAG: GNAT family N-acetyltransferase [Alphaproteobacteria bacterium]|nr:GNAT family N-acetyltransferase [Alphaproteobacteria bacterium]